jgi:hypothetical protein
MSEIIQVNPALQEGTILTGWLTEDYLKSLGYYKVSDDGQYGVYLNEHWKVISRTYGNLPKAYRRITFNRDTKYGVFFSVGADWGTRHSIRNALAVTQEEFETALSISI